MNLIRLQNNNFEVVRVSDTSVKAKASKCNAPGGIIEIEEATFEELVDGDVIWLKQTWHINEAYRQLSIVGVDNAEFARLLFYEYSAPEFSFVKEADEAINNFNSQTIYTKVADITVDGQETLIITRHKRTLYIPIFEKPISTGGTD